MYSLSTETSDTIFYPLQVPLAGDHKSNFIRWPGLIHSVLCCDWEMWNFWNGFFWFFFITFLSKICWFQCRGPYIIKNESGEHMEHMVSIILKACRFTDMLLKANYFWNGEMGEGKRTEWTFFGVTVHQSYVHIHVIKFIYFPLLRLSLNADLVSPWNLLFYCLRAVVRGVLILDWNDGKSFQSGI